MKCSDIEKAIAISSQMLVHGGIFTSDWFSDKLTQRNNKMKNAIWLRNTTKHNARYLFIAFSISIVTSTDRAIVMGCGSEKTSQSMSAHSLPPP